MPTIASVRKGRGALGVVVTWAKGARAGRTETIDLSPLVGALKVYKPLRDNPRLRASVHPIEEGHAIAWGEGDAIDMAATSLERLAEEAMTAEDLRAFMGQQNLTHAAAAALLGYSRRQIELYLSGAKPIPRVVALACHALKLRAERLESGFLSWDADLKPLRSMPPVERKEAAEWQHKEKRP
jgi:hypothetical protein